MFKVIVGLIVSNAKPACFRSYTAFARLEPPVTALMTYQQLLVLGQPRDQTQYRITYSKILN